MADGADKPDTPHWLDPPYWWKRVKPVRWIIVLALIAWIAHAFQLTRFIKLPDTAVPTFLKGEPHPETAQYTRVAVGVALADRFRSYQDLQSVTAELSAAGFDGWTTKSRRAAESSEYPPYGFDSVEVGEYRHLDSAGKLSLQFFNNRLYQAEFVPADPERYARKLRALGLQKDANARAEKIDGHLRLASTVDLAVSSVGKHLRTEPFVLWQDLRLVQERDQWDEKFGSIPKQMIGG